MKIIIIKNMILSFHLFVHNDRMIGSLPWQWSAVTMKITSPWTTGSKTHIGLVILLYIIMFKIRKIKPNLGSIRQKPKIFHDDWVCNAPCAFSLMYKLYPDGPFTWAAVFCGLEPPAARRRFPILFWITKVRGIYHHKVLTLVASEIST